VTCSGAEPSHPTTVVPIGIKEMYTRILKNRMSFTVIKCISIDGKAIPLVVIVLKVIIIVS
jgi:hypothetical protein